MHKTPAGQVAFGSQHAYAGYCDRAALLLQSEVCQVRSCRTVYDPTAVEVSIEELDYIIGIELLLIPPCIIWEQCSSTRKLSVDF
jgi:hypothetical protein